MGYTIKITELFLFIFVFCLELLEQSFLKWQLTTECAHIHVYSTYTCIKYIKLYIKLKLKIFELHKSTAKIHRVYTRYKYWMSQWVSGIS